ncbi:PREDICTED: transcription factor bHLH140 [Nicotiana attenuata]|uniref:Transcription factor bhlh140 n=1 Tax=Nicotiana attenuata TaxID=49451 RepID=A0A1J6JVI8_NICAT|nr:PREDICTED: transcription factor bHLH140 [Nicotiana attenuata]OIT21158.1 transcription factor bhlh140 [Nicotiana attenuata]
MEAMEIDPETNSKGKDEAKPIMVILMGAPGSGKSTFCDLVMRVSTRHWVRICQDTIGNGKAGTKNQCLAGAASALKEGKSVFIDRCNLDREQRADFVKLVGPEVEKHAVVLDLPAKVCISRSVKRTGHEGNLQGGKAAAVVNRMLQKKELPKLNEGYARITVCQDENNVQAAINTYTALGPSDKLPPGFFGQKNSDAKVQLGIMKFLKKKDPPGYSDTVTNVSPENIQSHATKKTDSNQVVESREEPKMTAAGSNISLENTPTLAFPSISTADFHFNLDKASDIIVEKVEEYVNKLGNARLVLVDLSQNSKILSLVKAKAAEKNIDSKKFFTFAGNITKLYSEGGLHCTAIANATNWRLKPGGGGVNAAIFSAAGPALETATKARIGSLSPGKAIVVPLPSSSPLFSREGVTHVIHVLGPNMNPQRPNHLNNDYVKGCQILREAYSSLFDGFASIARTQGEPSKDNFEKELKREAQPEQGSTNGDQKAKREAVCEADMNKKYKSFVKEPGPNVGSSGDGNSGEQTRKAWGSWAQALYDTAMHPERHKNIIEKSDDVVVLNDLYPKAQKHFLVLARVEGLDRLADVQKEHLTLLKTMHSVGLKWAEMFLSENNSLIFRLGYHSAPSMRQLHLHVISQDFDSKHLKNKKHWNSFNSPFFRDSVDVIDEVSQNGKATLKDENFLSMELRCHRCRSAHPNIPRLKAHISSCQASFPAFLLQNGRLVLLEGKDADH